MSGSGSLHSWNLEAPEEESVSDWLHLEKSVQEEEDRGKSRSASLEKQEQESEQLEEPKLELVKETMEGNREEEKIEESNNSEEEGKVEEERNKNESCEMRVSSEEEGNKPQVEEELIGNNEDKENQIMEENRSTETMKDLQEEPQQRENQEEEKAKTEVGPPHQNAAEEQQEQKADLQSANSQSHANEVPPQKLPEEAERRPSSPAPKVLSAVARFQSQLQSRGCQDNAGTREPAENQTSERLQSRDKVQTPANNSKKSSDEEEELPLIKVSELKKRFEA